MAITTLDPKTALVVVDLQKGLVSLPTVHPIDAIIKNTAVLADAFRRLRLPVVLVNVAGGAPGRTEQTRSTERPAGWTDIIPDLHQRPLDHLVTKRTWGAPRASASSQPRATRTSSDSTSPSLSTP